MKLKFIFAALFFALCALPLKAQICCYTPDECYGEFYNILKNHGDELDFIKWCIDDFENSKYGYKITADFPCDGAYITNCAADAKRFEALKFFIEEKKFYVDKVRYSLSPLQFAAKNGDYKMAKYLLDKGASPVKLSYYYKKDAYEYAKMSGVKSVIDLVGEAWRKWQSVAELRIEEYKKEIKDLNLNDYEKFKKMHNLGSFNSSSFWGFNRA